MLRSYTAANPTPPAATPTPPPATSSTPAPATTTRVHYPPHLHLQVQKIPDFQSRKTLIPSLIPKLLRPSLQCILTM